MGLIACSLAACAAEVTEEDFAQAEVADEVAAKAEALNGMVNLSGNCAGQDDRIKRIVSNAAALAGSTVLTDCLKRAIPSYDDWSFPERIRSELGQNVTTNVTCVDRIRDGAGNDTGFTGRAFFQSDGSERLELSTVRMPGFDDADLIGLILHEVSHNRRYLHPTNTASPDYAASYPEHLLACARTAFRGQAIRPQGTTRYDFQTETTLAPVGGIGGGPIVKSCGTGRRMAGLRIQWSGSQIDALGARCRSNPNVTPVLDFSVMGGTGGTPVNSDCALGEVMVGVYGHVNNNLVTRIGPVCASITSVQNGATGPDTTAALRFRATAGNPSGYNFERICPARMVVEQLRGRAGAAIDRLELYCQRIDRPANILETYLTKAGGNGGATAYSDRCAGRSAMVGLTYDVDWVLGRLGGECMELSQACWGGICFETATTGVRHVLGSHGGGTLNPASERTERCPAGQALVGLQIRSGALVDAVGGICAGITAWSVPPNIANAPTTDLPMRGGPGGGLLPRQMCPRQTFLVGWEMRTGALVDSVRPVCRRFG